MNARVYVTVRAKGAEFPRYMWYSSLLNQKEISCVGLTIRRLSPFRRSSFYGSDSFL